MCDPAVDDLLPLPAAVFHILVALAERDGHGYSIMQDVAERAKIKLSPGTLYTSIRKMMDQGLITELREAPDPENDDPRRRYYRLTDFGRQVARAEAARFADLVRQARETGLAV